MKRNSRLSLALHALGHMAAHPDRPLTSVEIAEHNETHPAFVRRVLGLLREAKLVTSEKGHHGGWMLMRKANEISLADVYRALDERFMRPDPKGEDHPQGCLVEKRLRAKVDAALNAAEKTLIKELSQDTIIDISLHTNPDMKS